MTSGVLVIEFGGIGQLSGGLGDRCVGLVSAILLAQHVQKPLLIHWISPQSIFSIPAHFVFSPEKLGSLPTQHLNCMDHQGLAKFQPKWSTWRNSAINLILRCNQDLGPLLGATEAEKTAIYQRLFPDYLGITRAPSADSCYVALQIRTGDTYLKVGDRQFVANVAKTQTMLLQFLEDEYPDCQDVYVSTDHPTFKRDFEMGLQKQGKRMLQVKASENFHFERSQKAGPGTGKALLDDLLWLAGANTLVISGYSNYGKLAAQIRNVPEGSLYAFGENDYLIKQLG